MIVTQVSLRIHCRPLFPHKEVTFDTRACTQIVLVEGLNFMVQREIPMHVVREAKAVGESCLEITTRDKTPVVFVLGAYRVSVRE